jgi:hypothetical protein
VLLVRIHGGGLARWVQLWYRLDKWAAAAYLLQFEVLILIAVFVAVAVAIAVFCGFFFFACSDEC